ncbi:hypothetical protein CXB51_010752 [Gossypium anomalum]|uniref:Uncharacterized protein n=1 Tax=Gossypium anomalum TaxID=47600 RepID=A0A8J5YN70_9ROSI|nr:hypothetical protein CXB51_010752 [Gossypium anomalum]
MLRSLCIGIDCGINQLLHVQFIIILQHANCIDNALVGLIKREIGSDQEVLSGTLSITTPLFSCLLAGWLAEERRVPSGRLYKVKPLIV